MLITIPNFKEFTNDHITMAVGALRINQQCGSTYLQWALE